MRSKIWRIYHHKSQNRKRRVQDSNNRKQSNTATIARIENERRVLARVLDKHRKKKRKKTRYTREPTKKRCTLQCTLACWLRGAGGVFSESAISNRPSNNDVRIDNTSCSTTVSPGKNTQHLATRYIRLVRRTSLRSQKSRSSSRPSHSQATLAQTLKSAFDRETGIAAPLSIAPSIERASSPSSPVLPQNGTQPTRMESISHNTGDTPPRWSTAARKLASGVPPQEQQLAYPHANDNPKTVQHSALTCAYKLFFPR